MNDHRWLILTVILISCGGAMLGQTLSRWTQHKVTQVQMLAGLASAFAAIGAGVAIRMRRTGHPSAEWIALGCVLLFTSAILIATREATRTGR